MVKEVVGEISFKASYARGQSILVPVALIGPLLAIFIVVWTPFCILTIAGVPQDMILYAILTVAFLAPYLFFLYGKPWKKLAKMHSPPKVIVANQNFLLDTLPKSKHIKPMIGTRARQNLKRQKEVVHAIEDKIHLAKMLDFRFDGIEFGAYLQENSLKELVVVWVFECEGINYSLSDDQYVAIGVKLQDGLADYSRSGSLETLTFDAEVRSNCVNSLEKTQTIREAKALPYEDLFILDGIDDRTRDLTRDGQLASRSLRIYATTNLSQLNLSADDPDLSDRLQAALERAFTFLKSPDDAKKELRDQLTLAYEQGFKRWKRLIETKLELPIQTLSFRDAWQIPWDEVNDGPAPVPNHSIEISDEGLKFHRSDDARLLASLLFQYGEPKLTKDAVWLPGRNQWMGACIMTKFPNRTWLADQRKAQLTYGSAAINTPSALNTRVLVQLSAVSPEQTQFAANWRVKTENSAKSWNAKRGTKDVGSEVMMDDAVEVARSQKKGATSIKWAWVAMVYRPTVSKLNDAMAQLIEHSSFSGNIVLRERGYCDQVWLTSLPSLTAHKMLQKTLKPETLFCSFERRIENETDAVVGVLPIMREQLLHSKGYQLVSRLKEPIFLDPVGKKPHLNTILLGEKGSGKSKLVQALGKNAMIQGARLIIIDGARTDGSGSFDEWASYEPNSAYFNPNRDASNIFDAVDQRYLAPFDPDDKDSIDVWGGFEGFLIRSLSDLSCQGTSPSTSAKFKQLHSYFIGEFYRNGEIRSLRDAAFDGGMGSVAWEQMPTLHHYLKFLSVENLPSDIREYVNPEILVETKAALYALLQQRLGKAIARPTNVNFDDARLIVYAMSAIPEADMLPLGIAMTGSILAQTNKKGLKLLIFEEMALNLRHEILALMAAEAAAQGRKKNQHCIFVSQDVQPIVDSPAGNDILKNSPVTVVGMVVPAAAEGISKTCKIPLNAVLQCTQASFMPSSEKFGRNFLISTKDGHLFATDYSDFRSLFMVMNESDELDLKAQMKARYPDNKYTRINEGAKILRSQSIHAEKP
jgi:hypothetical protein